MKEKKVKQNKIAKLPFYLKPLEKTLETMTTALIGYFYRYAQENYKESCEYDKFLENFHFYMKTNNISEDLK